MDELFALISTVLAHPVIKAGSLAMSVASFGIALYSLRKIHQVTTAQVQHMRTEHLRYLNDKRSEIDLLTLKDREVADLVSRNFAIDGGAEEARGEALLCLYLNVAASAHAARKNDLISQDEYEKHMRFILDDFAGDPDYLWSVIRANSYPAGFEKQCRQFLAAARKTGSVRAAQRTRTPTPQPVA
jgi:hypothetical protein